MTQKTITIDVAPRAMSNIRLTEPYKLLLCHSAAYCLQKSSKQLPVGQIYVADSRNWRRKFPIDWIQIPLSEMPVCEATYADEKEVVEYAAYGVTLAYLSAVHGIHAFARAASTGTGFDYYLNSPLSTGPTPVGPLHRLEVSGIFSGPINVLGRLRNKLKQSLRLKIRGTARAAVVEFAEPRIAIYLRTVK